MRHFLPRTSTGWGQIFFGLLAICMLVASAWAMQPTHNAAPPSMPDSFDLQGRADVHDGDSLRIGHTKIRLWGIDAPEIGQNCRIETGHAPCGDQARDAMRVIIGDNALNCVKKGISYDRVVAQCFAGDVDVARALVQQGYAISEWYHSRAPYQADEKAAKSAQSGMWAMAFAKPSEWRLCNLPKYEGKRPSRCGRNYHPT